MEDCALHDLDFVGGAFTWRNQHHDAPSYTKERLGRVVVNSAWRARFSLVRVINGDPRYSDHRSIIVEPRAKEKTQWRKPLEIMKKFEAKWLEEEECSERVEEGWEKAISRVKVSLMEIQKNVLAELWEWNRTVLRALEKRIKDAKRELELCRRHPISQGQINKEHMLWYRLERLLDQHRLVE
jgi:DNA-directed RNA polymerase